MNRTVLANDPRAPMYRGTTVLALDVQSQRLWDVDHNNLGGTARWTLRINTLMDLLTNDIRMVILRTSFNAIVSDNEEEKLIDFFQEHGFELAQVVVSPSHGMNARAVYLRRLA